jgi:hypothetical protein
MAAPERREIVDALGLPGFARAQRLALGDSEDVG